MKVTIIRKHDGKIVHDDDIQVDSNDEKVYVDEAWKNAVAGGDVKDEDRKEYIFELDKQQE